MSLTTDEVTKIYNAVLLGVQCPIDTHEAYEAYDQIKSEVDGNDGKGFDVPGEIPE